MPSMIERLDALAGRLGELRGVMAKASAVGRKYISAVPVVRAILDAIGQKKDPDLSKHSDGAVNDAAELLEAGVEKTGGTQKKASSKLSKLFGKSKAKVVVVNDLAATVLHVCNFVRREQERRRKPTEDV